MLWVSHDIGGIPFFPAAVVWGKKEARFVSSTGKFSREVVTVNNRRIVTRQKEVYVSPHDMLGEVGAYTPDGDQKIDHLEQHTVMVLFPGLLGMSVHT